MEQNKKYCKALKEGTAFNELYKGCTDRVLCEENPCIHGHKDRSVETRCMDGKERFVCPLEKGLVEIPKKPRTGLEAYFMGKQLIFS